MISDNLMGLVLFRLIGDYWGLCHNAGLYSKKPKNIMPLKILRKQG